MGILVFLDGNKVLFWLHAFCGHFQILFISNRKGRTFSIFYSKIIKLLLVVRYGDPSNLKIWKLEILKN